jgi:hypothetical protein
MLSTPVFAGSFEDIAEDVSSKIFPQHGLVTKVGEEKIELNKGRSSGLFTGETLFIYRPMGVVKDPYSGEVFQARKGLAYAIVADLREDSGWAKIIGGAEEKRKRILGIIPEGFRNVVAQIKIGDRWQAGTTTMKVGIVTRKPIVYERLKEALEKTGKFYVVGADEFQIALTAEKIVDLNNKENRATVGRALDLEMLFFVNVEDNKDVSCRVFSGYDGRRIARYRSVLNKKLVLSEAKSSIPAQNLVSSSLELKPRLTFYEKALNTVGLYAPLRIPSSTPTLELIASSSLRALSTAFYMGDIDNDGKIEIVVALGRKVVVYRFNGDSFTPVMSFGYGWNIFNIDCADINNDGLKEMFFSNFDRFGNLSSFIGCIKENKFCLIKDKIRYYIRTYKGPEKLMIIAQESGITRPFYGGLYEINENGKIKDKLELPISPRNLFDFYKIKDGKIVYLDKSGRLVVYDQGEKKVLYMTEMSFGRNLRPIEKYEGHPAAVSKALIVFKKEAKIYAMVINNVRESSVSLRTEKFFGGNIKIYEIGDKCFRMVWASGDTAGRISGFGKIGNTIITVREMPTPVLTRLIKGESGVDVLTAGKMRH